MVTHVTNTYRPYNTAGCTQTQTGTISDKASEYWNTADRLEEWFGSRWPDAINKFEPIPRDNTIAFQELRWTAFFEFLFPNKKEIPYPCKAFRALLLHATNLCSRYQSVWF